MNRTKSIKGSCFRKTLSNDYKNWSTKSFILFFYQVFLSKNQPLNTDYKNKNNNNFIY